MSIVENRPVAPAAWPQVPLAPVLVVAEDDDARILIGALLSVAGQEPELVLAGPDAVADRRVDGSTVVIVTCDVARPVAVTELRRLRRTAREAAIVVVSPPLTATAVRRTLDAGADAVVVEPQLARTLIPTLRAVESGQSVVPRNLRAAVERPYLSHRERQVLDLVCAGRTNAEIADSLVLAESTIKSHMASIFTKFGVHSRREAVAAFADLNLAAGETHT
jgi:DNA-binding NarL/FixJ family response regulator